MMEDAEAARRKAEQAKENLLREIAKRKRAEEALRDKTEQLQAVTAAMTAFLESGNWRAASALLLRSALRQTASEYGFIGVVVEGPTLRILAHEGIVWDAAINREFYEQALRTYHAVGYLEFTNFENLFGTVLTSGQAVLANDPGTDPRAGGLPPGHPALRHFLGVPILRGTEAVGMIGVANRPGGYSGAEQAKIDILTQATAVLYDSYRRREREAALEEKRQRAEEALRESEVKFRTLAETTAAAITFVQGTQVGYVNPAAEAMTGYTRDELLAMNFWDIVHPEFRQLVKEWGLARLRGEPVPSRYEIKILTKNGEERWLDLRPALIELERKPTVLSTAFDITERKRAEEALREREQQLQEANRLKSDFVAALAHELRNSVAVIAANAALLDYGRMTVSELRRVGTRITQSTQAIQELTTALLDADRLESGQSPVRWEEFVLADLLRELEAEVSQMPRNEAVRVQWNVAEGIPPLTSDRTLLKTVLRNLVDNALKYTDHGSVRMEAHYLADREQLALSVADSGVGLSKEEIPFLFEMYRRGGRDQDHPGGVGLGLYLVKRILHHLQGEIAVESELGKGSVFRVYLPRKPALKDNAQHW